MAGLFLHTSNKIDALASKLVEQLGSISKNPFLPDTIIVQSSGMEKWLRYKIASHNGIAANINFPFPNSFLSDSFRKILGSTPFETHFARDPLTWKIFRIISNNRELLDKSGFGVSLANDTDKSKQYTLADILADLFDQYAIYRPQWIDAWQNGKTATENDEWQAAIYRELSAECCGETRLSTMREFEKKLLSENVKELLPPMLSVFGISSLPPFHIKGLELLSKVIDVHIYVLNPCREHWFNIVPETTGDRIRLITFDEAVLLHLDDSNPLLGNFGTQGREFLSSIFQIVSDFSDMSIPSSRTTLLESIQDDLLNLTQPAKTGFSYSLSHADNSLRVHDCCSVYREVQVLYNSVLNFLDNDPSLNPRDIIVMAPDISNYSSAVNALFGNPEDPSLKIPYTIADQTSNSENHFISAFLLMMNIPESRFTSNELISLLSNTAIRRKFDIDEEELAEIKGWLSKLRVSWGLNQEHLDELNLPSNEHHIHSAGCKRLLLGYMLPHSHESEAFGCLPYPSIEGDSAELAGKYSSFITTLAHIKKTLSQNHSAASWAENLMHLFELFALPGENDNENDIFKSLHTLKESSIAAGLNEELPFALFRKHLTDKLAKTMSGRGFLSTGITFCSMLPMRCIPFKGIAILGMDSSFPRETFPVSFDLMRKAGARKAGDRSREQDDRYIFLETIISAEKWLHISFIGHDVEKNTVLPPSSVLNELIDYIVNNSKISRNEVENILFVHHPLHPFSKRYFGNGDPHKLFSYSARNASICAAAGSKANNSIRRLSICEKPLTITPQTEITPDGFIEPFVNPARFFIERALQLKLYRDYSTIEDHEPFTISKIDSAQIKRALIALPTTDPAPAFDKYRLSAIMPPGNVAHSEWNSLTFETELLLAELKKYTNSSNSICIPVDINCPSIRINGSITTYEGNETFIFLDPVKATITNLLKVWIKHLLLNYAKNSNCTTLFIDREASVTMFTPPPQPIEIINSLEKLYLKAISLPLPFSPTTSAKYMESIISKNPSHERGIANAEDEWEKDNDPYNKFVWQRSSITEHEEFAATARAILENFYTFMEKQ